MISFRKIHAIMHKDFKSLLHNVFVLSGLLIVPIVAFVMNLTAEGFIIELAVMFVQMNILMNGANIICVMIAEEKEKQTLGVLKASTVSGLDFLISKLLINLILTAIVTMGLYFMLDVGQAIALGPFMIITSVAILPVAAIGAIVGIATKTQSAASTIVAPFALIFIFLPIAVPATSSAWNVLQYLFSEQTVRGMLAIYNGESYMSYIGKIGRAHV